MIIKLIDCTSGHFLTKYHLILSWELKSSGQLLKQFLSTADGMHFKIAANEGRVPKTDSFLNSSGKEEAFE